jgi:hypothetical protein
LVKPILRILLPCLCFGRLVRCVNEGDLQDRINVLCIGREFLLTHNKTVPLIVVVTELKRYERVLNPIYARRILPIWDYV